MPIVESFDIVKYWPQSLSSFRRFLHRFNRLRLCTWQKLTIELKTKLSSIVACSSFMSDAYYRREMYVSRPFAVYDNQLWQSPQSCARWRHSGKKNWHDELHSIVLVIKHADVCNNWNPYRDWCGRVWKEVCRKSPALVSTEADSVRSTHMCRNPVDVVWRCNTLFRNGWMKRHRLWSVGWLRLTTVPSRHSVRNSLDRRLACRRRRWQSARHWCMTRNWTWTCSSVRRRGTFACSSDRCSCTSPTDTSRPNRRCKPQHCRLVSVRLQRWRAANTHTHTYAHSVLTRCRGILLKSKCKCKRESWAAEKEKLQKSRHIFHWIKKITT